MPNFAGEMHHHELRHLSSTLLDREQGLELIMSFAAGSRLHGGALHHRGQSQYPVIKQVARPARRALQRLLNWFWRRAHVISRQRAGELPSFCPSGKGEHRRHIVTTGQNLSVATSTFSPEAPISNKNMDPKLVSQLHIKSHAISTKTWLPSLELCKGVTNSQDDGPCPF